MDGQEKQGRWAGRVQNKKKKQAAVGHPAAVQAGGGEGEMT